jgi:hypothetical protein
VGQGHYAENSTCDLNVRPDGVGSSRRIQQFGKDEVLRPQQLRVRALGDRMVLCLLELFSEVNYANPGDQRYNSSHWPPAVDTPTYDKFDYCNYAGENCEYPKQPRRQP